MALSAKQQALIDAYIANPLIEMNHLAEQMGIQPKTAYNWRWANVNGFKDELERRLAEKWEKMKYMATQTMSDLAEEGDFKAAKYILDYKGYAPTQKVEAKVEGDISINISLGDN